MNKFKYSFIVIAAALFILGGCQEEKKSFGIELSVSGTHNFPSKEANTGYTVESLSITVTNTGNQPTGALQVAMTGATSDGFEVKPNILTTIGENQTAQFTVTPKLGLRSGNYEATITVSGTSNIEPKSFSVAFEVEPHRTARIELSQTDPHQFDTVHEDSGYEVTPLEVTVSSVGELATGALQIALSGAAADKFVLSKSAINNIETGETETFEVAPKLGLVEDTYTATVTVSGANINSKTFNVEFVVAEKLIYSIELSQKELYQFPPVGEDSNYEIANLNVTVSNTGNRPTGALQVALSGAAADKFTLSANEIASINAGSTAPFTVSTTRDLPYGIYSATVTVSGGENIEPQSFGIQLTVTEKPEFRIGAPPTKTEYGVGEPINMAGLVIETRVDGVWTTYSGEVKTVAYDFSTAGEDIKVTITVDADIPLEFNVEVLTLAQRITAALGTTATIIMYASEEQAASVPVNVANTHITLTTSDNTERIFKRIPTPADAGGTLLSIGGTASASVNAKLTVTGYVNLKGLSTPEYGGTDSRNNSTALVNINNGGTLELKGHAKLTGNTNNSGFGGGVRIAGAGADYVSKSFLILDENAEISGNTSLAASASGVSYGGAIYASDCAEVRLKGNAKITKNISRNTLGVATAGGLWQETYSKFYMEGGEVSENVADGETNSSAGGLNFNNASSFAFLSGGVIRDNVVKFKTFGRGSAMCTSQLSRVVITDKVSIVPKSGGAYTATMDDRNSIFLQGAGGGRLNIFGELNSATSFLVDLDVLRSITGDFVLGNCTYIGDFSVAPVSPLITVVNFTDENPAPAEKFRLGHTVNLTTGAIGSLDAYELKTNGRAGLIE